MADIDFSKVKINSPEQFELNRKIIQIIQKKSKSNLGIERAVLKIEVDKVDTSYKGEKSLDKVLKHFLDIGLLTKEKLGYWDYTELGEKVAEIESYDEFNKLKKEKEKKEKEEKKLRAIQQRLHMATLCKESKEKLINYLMNVSEQQQYNIFEKLDDIKKRIKSFETAVQSDEDISDVNLKYIIKTVSDYAGHDYDIDFTPDLSALLTICQNMGVTDFKIYLPNNWTLNSRFHRLDEGSEGCGKSFVGENLQTGKEDENIPPIGIPLVKTLSSSITTPAFVETLWLYELVPYNWIYISSEISSWLNNKHMINQLKKATNNEVMEWELKVRATITPFKCKGSFIFNRNRVFRKNEGLSETNPDLKALKSRCIEKGWQYTPKEWEHIKKQGLKCCVEPERFRKVKIFLCKAYKKIHNSDYSVVFCQKDLDELQKVLDVYTQYLKSLTRTEDFDLKIGRRLLNNSIRVIACLTMIENVFTNNSEQFRPSENLIKLGENFLFTLLEDMQPTILKSQLHNGNVVLPKMTTNSARYFYKIPRGLTLEDFLNV